MSSAGGTDKEKRRELEEHVKREGAWLPKDGPPVGNPPRKPPSFFMRIGAAIIGPLRNWLRRLCQ